MQKLSNYGHSFQVKLITCLLTDVKFSSRVFDLLRIEYFDSDALIWLCDTILNYYQEYHSLATMEVLKVGIDSIEDALMKEEVIKNLRDAYGFVESPDLQFIKESTIEFCRNQELQFAIMESVDLIKQGKFEAIKARIDEALKRGEDKNVGLDYLQDIDLRYEDMARSPITTGFPILDDLTQGGLSAGEIGIVVGPGGSGKSWVLTSLCTHAMLKGHKTLYITLELNEAYVGVRADCILTGISMDDLKDNRELVKNRLSRVTGEMRIQWYPTRALSLIGLRSLLDRLILLEKKPDILYIDYADLMKLTPSKNKRKDEELQELYEEIRGISGEYMIPIWTASQANRSSHDDEVEYVSAGMISESMGKHFTADFMLSILRKDSDKESHAARFHVIKNRFGPDGITLLSKMDTNHGIIEIFRPAGKKHKEMENELLDMETNPRNKLKSRYEKFYSDE
jgi:replicative DNA helicase